MHARSYLLLATLVSTAEGHGALTVPTTRRGNTGYENDPVAFDSEAWVCRHAVRNPDVPLFEIEAGQKTQITWSFSAAHVGDCAVFLSYDVTKPLAEQRYFKIANLPKCKDQNRLPVDIDMPDWLPGGEAILRWDWYGLHQGAGNPEFYSQCADLNVKPGPRAVTTESIVKYPIIGAYPKAKVGGQSTGAYRNAFGSGKNLDDPGFIMTGPPCADKDSPLNNCDLTKTAEGGGAIDGGDGDGGDGGGGDTAEPPACSPILYTVQMGDTLTSIADANSLTQQVDWIQICSANTLPDCNVIEVGQELTIPCDVNLSAQLEADDSDGGSDGGSGGVIAGVVITLLLAGALIAFAIWRYKKPAAAPPPPKQVVEVGAFTA